IRAVQDAQRPLYGFLLAWGDRLSARWEKPGPDQGIGLDQQDMETALDNFLFLGTANVFIQPWADIRLAVHAEKGQRRAALLLRRLKRLRSLQPCQELAVQLKQRFVTPAE